MGTYLKYRVEEKEKRKAASTWLQKKSDRELGLWDEKDVRIETEKGDRGWPDYLPLGTGQLKISGIACEDEPLREKWVDILIEARQKFGLECFDVPSNVGDYIDEEKLARLIDLPQWRKTWEKEAKEEERWEKARGKTTRAAEKEYPAGIGMLVSTWSDKRAHLVFTDVSAEDHPAWLGVSYDIKGNWSVGTKRNDNHRFELLQDAYGQAFLAIPLMALGDEGTKGGYRDVWEYLKRAHGIGLATNPDVIMIGAYHAVPSRLDFGKSVKQLAAPKGPYVLGKYEVKTGAACRAHYRALVTRGDGNLEFDRIGNQRGVLLEKERKEFGLDSRVWCSYPALASLYEKFVLDYPKSCATE